jgi:hypothetical protein
MLPPAGERKTKERGIAQDLKEELFPGTADRFRDAILLKNDAPAKRLRGDEPATRRRLKLDLVELLHGPVLRRADSPGKKRAAPSPAPPQSNLVKARSYML